MSTYDPANAPYERLAGHKGDGWTVSLPPIGSETMLLLDMGIDSVAIARVPNGRWNHGACRCISWMLASRSPKSIPIWTARTDIGMAARFSHTWVTDWQIAFRITNGMTMALPPEFVDWLVGGQDGHTTADIDFRRDFCSSLARPSPSWTLSLGRSSDLKAVIDFSRA